VGIGASLIALFIRAGGGIFTKAADLGADLVGKVEAGIPEDDPRNPATIADNVGDNVGDAAGMGSDVYESYIVTILAVMLLGALIVPASLQAIGGDGFGLTTLSVIGIEVNPLVLYPMLIGASGLIASIIGAMTITSRKISDPMKPLNIAFMVSAAIAIALNFFFTTTFLGYNVLSYALFTTTVVGVILVPVIQRITDYYTNYKYKPVKEIADSTKWGYASNTLTGIIMGMQSAGPFMLAIVVVLGVSYSITFGITQDPLMGIYGTAIAAMAMLSLAGIVLCIDAFGPISDNAGGIVEMTGMGDENRTITDKIDAVGNTTKAITKGFAIASAGLAALAMIQAFQHEADKLFPAMAFEYSLSDVGLIIGLLVGGLIPFFVTSQLIGGVSRSAAKMVDEVRRQFKEKPGIMDGTDTPDYARCVDIATGASLKELWKPAVVTVAAPIITGVLLGPTAVAGVLMGAVVSGLFLAYHLANSGGAWDNAKKYIEMQGKKKTEAHAVAVVGDLIGDPYKDTAGPALNTVIKLLNTVAIVFVPVFIAILAL
jgi:K(+)-stimulated pyrophosphate-energized sodium pump